MERTRLIVRSRVEAELGYRVPCYKPLGGWTTRAGGITFVRPEMPSKERTVACGQCLGCRLDKSREWAARIIHESMGYHDNCFITLTYEDGDLPPGGSLVKQHFQKFMKRLRKEFKGQRIRYYQCGEYGDKLERPHYHACLFGLDFSDKELFKEREGVYLFTSETLEKLWGHGFCTLGELSFDSAAYVSRYVVKKITGRKAEDHYLRHDEYGVAIWLEPEYSTMSRGGNGADGVQKGGIGKDWYDEYKTDVFPSDEVPVPGVGVFRKVPRYYEKLLREEDRALFDEIKDERQRFLKDHIEDFSPQRLEDKYIVAKARFGLSRRSFEEHENEHIYDF